MKLPRRAVSSAVIDSSCLICLLHLDQNTETHDLIRSLSLRYSRIYIPGYVIREVNRKHRTRHNLNRLLKRYAFLSRCAVTDEARVMMLADPRLESSIRIDQGEAEAIVQARERSVPVVLIDDIAGRRVAASHSLQVTGTLGVLKELKLNGIIQEIRPLIEKLKRDTEFRIASDIVEEVLRETGESL